MPVELGCGRFEGGVGEQRQRALLAQPRAPDWITAATVRTNVSGSLEATTVAAERGACTARASVRRRWVATTRVSRRELPNVEDQDWQVAFWQGCARPRERERRI